MNRLACVAQKYDWGIKGKDSSVANLFSLGGAEVTEIEDATPYAELWMGTHTSGPSKLIPDSTLLKDWIASNPQSLGEIVQKKWSGSLPYLFKVLSVAKALSIQVHPDKELAEKLHKEQPQYYKDDNHKPEMALAVTEFEALCGFVTFQELQSALSTNPELYSVVGTNISQLLIDTSVDSADEVKKSVLKDAFTALMTSDKDFVKSQLAALIARLNEDEKSRQLLPKEKLILRVEKQYPGDVGVFSIFFLNYITLKVGEAIYLAANEPHAYLSGECIECMAASDNVIRAGLTPKYRDTDTLCSCLTYNQGAPEILKGVSSGPYSAVYQPPFEEFEVERIQIPSAETYLSPVLKGASILLCFEGSGIANYSFEGVASISELKKGFVYFVAAGVELQITAEENGVELFRAQVNSTVFQ